MNDQKSKRLLIWLVSAIAVIGCGRAAPPLAPEMFSPRAIRDLTVTGVTDGVKLVWRSPAADLRGGELESMDGYRIYRRQAEGRRAGTEEADSFELLATVRDEHVEIRERLRDEARAVGKPARRIKADESYEHFEYLDNAVNPGDTYLYRVVPYNQRDVEGKVRELIRVMFRGESSEVSFLSASDFDEDVLPEVDQLR